MIDASNKKHERNFIPAFFRDDSTIKGGFNQLHGLPWYFFYFGLFWLVYPSDFRSSVEGVLVVCKGVHCILAHLKECTSMVNLKKVGDSFYSINNKSLVWLGIDLSFLNFSHPGDDFGICLGSSYDDPWS